MEDKYYTPELTELYIGCEVYMPMEGQEELIRVILNDANLGNSLDYKTSLSYVGSINEYKETTTYSVPESMKMKYLDKEGIEQALKECGFIFTCYPSKISDPGIPFWWLIKRDPQGKVANHTFQLSIIDGFLKIEENTDGHRKGYYYGKCKNKSKLQHIS